MTFLRIAIAAALPLVCAVTQAVEIRLKSDYECTENMVTLGQVASMNGDEAEVERLSRIQLFPAPAKGRERVLRAGEVHELLRLNGFDLLDHRITGAASSTVRRSKVMATRTDNSSKQPMLAVVAANSLIPGQMIRESDVKTIEFRHRPQGMRVATDVREVVGREPSRVFTAGQAIELNQLRRPTAVRKQTQITVFSRASGVEVRTLAKALEDGAVGDLIQVESIGTKDRYAARVSGIQQAEVFASGSTIPRSATYSRITRVDDKRPVDVRVTRFPENLEQLER